jgi:hypothetical protein
MHFIQESLNIHVSTRQVYAVLIACVQVTLSNTKGLMWDVPTYDRPPWNSIMEFDLVFKLPNMTKSLSAHEIASRRQDALHEPRSQHRRERRQFYRQMENVLDVWVWERVDASALRICHGNMIISVERRRYGSNCPTIFCHGQAECTHIHQELQ